MGPRFAGVGGFVNPIAHREIGPMQALTATDINDVGIGRGNGDRSNRLRAFVIEDGIPSPPIVVRFPTPAIYLPDVKHIRLAWNFRSGASASATKRANHSPTQILVSVFGNLRPTCSSGQKNDEAHT